MSGGTTTMDGISLGESGGIFAGVVALLALLGKGIMWVTNLHEERSASKAAKLQAWEDSLARREQEQRAELEEKFGELQAEVATSHSQIGALAVALFDVTSALRGNDPTSPALTRAAATLRAAFPMDHNVPVTFRELLARLDAKDIR